MPVRIYEIAKQLGIPNKEILAKAKELGIQNARVASSSLDKITAEFLVEQLSGGKEEETATVETAAPPAPEPIKIVKKEPEPEPPQEAPQEDEPATDESVAAAPSSELGSPPPAEPSPAEVDKLRDQAISEPTEPDQPQLQEAGPDTAEAQEPVPPKEEPTKSRVGQVVGRIDLGSIPTRPAARDKSQKAKPEPGRSEPARPELGRRGGRERERDRGRRGTAPAQPAKPTGPSRERSIDLPANAPTVTLKQPIIVRDLAEQMDIKPFKLIADLMEQGVFANVNQAVEDNTARQICAKYGFKFELEKRSKESHVVQAQPKEVELDAEDRQEDLAPRAPVVTIMGHVDHGKTSLLDVIRKSDVTSGEAGGITQHIGAYTISFPHPERKKQLQQITFLDTPGHAAFSAMRARGANVTDIVILVVAADDGVMPQTMEALNHAKAARVPIIVAINKCDLPAANPMKVRQQLQEKGLVPDDWGGDTIFVEVSAFQKQGVDKLLEMILLQADLLELKANPHRRAFGNVIESGLEPGGPTATVLVRKGTLKVGSVVICGPYVGKARALINEEGKRLKEAGPSVAVKILGLNGVPEAGLEFAVVENEKVAREMASNRAEQARKELREEEQRNRMTLESLFKTLEDAQSKVLKLVVKGDTQGSVEAIVDALNKIESDKVSLEVIHNAVGTITESDVNLASASQAVIIGFHTRIDNGVSDLAKHNGVQIKLYSIIYELVEEVKLAMAGLLDPVTRENVIGSAEVRKVFTLSKGGNVAGCMVSNGRILRGNVRVLRNNNRIYEGHTQSLRRFQDEVNEVRAGMECGIRLDGFDQFEEGDTIECYTVEKVAQKL